MTTAPPAGWYKDPGNPGLVRWWDGAHWTAHTNPAPSQPATPPSAPEVHRRRVDYRDRNGTYWRFLAGATYWERYDGTQWVTSATRPPGSMGSFNPLTSGGRRRNQRLMFVTFAVFGSLLIWLATATHMPGELLVGLFLWVVAIVAGVSSVRKQQSR